MAEFALGLTKTAVEGTLSRVKSAVEEGVKQRERVQEDLMFITGEFQMMQAFLNASSAGERASKNLVARAWVRQLRNLAFDVEDCVEFVVSLDKPSPWDWVQRLASSLPCLARPPLPLDEAVAEIKRLKARVEDVSQRNTRYNLMAGGGDNDCDDKKQLLVGHTSAAGAENYLVLRDIWKAMRKLSDATGDLKRLINCQGRELKVISLWGSPQDDVPGELGWASIVKKAYDDPEICQEFQNRAWVKVPHPFYPVEFLNNLLTQFTSQHHRHDDMSKLLAQVSQHKYLVVLEKELSSIADWDAIKVCLPDDNNGSRIITSTKHLEIARVCTGEPFQVWEFKRFAQDRYLCALFPKDSDGVGSQQVKEGGLFVGHEDKMIFINPDAGVNLFAVWGIAGVGKSALVREKYNKSSESYIKQGWADVPNPFNLMSLCRRLLLDFFSADVHGKETAAIAMMEGQDPIQECCKILRQNKCFLVIDGLQSTHDWDLIKAALLSQARNDGLTFVITREESIARHCTISEKHIYNLNGLLPDKALDLFKKITLDGKKLCEFPHEAAVTSELIVSKCGGIPQVIFAIGKAARTNHMKIGHFESVNTRFMDILVDASSNSSSLRGLFCWMQSYLKACSDELKPCIFYLSVFSAGKSIRWKRLIRRWMAEGYLSGCGATAEEKADKLVLQLWKLSILYLDPQTSRFNLKANGFFREYIKSQPLEDYLVFELEGSCSPSPRLAGQHLTISSSWDRDEVVFNSIDMSWLRSLTVFGKWVPFLISDKMKVLRVLDLEGTSSTLESDGKGVVTNDDLEMIVKKFPRLKFMSLRGCKHITCLPDSLGAMKQLETLNIRHTSIVELPPAVITKLNKLQYVRAGTTNARSLQAAAAAETMPTPSPLLTTTTTTTEDDVHCGMSPLLGAKAAASCVLQRASTRITGAWKRRAHALVESSSSSSWWESKKQRRRRVRVAANGGGVEVVPAAAEGIGKLTLLHRLSVVNIAGGKGGLLLLKEIKKLTQLWKLGLSGINQKNWKDLTLAISGHLPHLESLSLQLLLLEKDGNYEFACFEEISLEPKTLKRLKVFYNSTGGGAGAGAACIRPAWIEQFPNLERFNHEVRVSSAADMDSIGSRWLQDESYVMNEHRVPRVEQRLGIKPIDQHLSTGQKWLALDSLVIYCSGIISRVTCGPLSVKAVRIHCCSSCGGSSCLRIDGLESIRYLKEVFVTGPCSDGFKEELQKQLHKHEGRPALRLL